MDYFISAIKKYAVFKGRSSRKEFWYFALFNVIFSIIAGILDTILGTSKMFGAYGLITSIYYLGMIIPGIAITVRRLHDVNKSGWMYLILAIPTFFIFGILIYLGISTKMDLLAMGLLLQSNLIIYIILMISSLVGGIWMLILLLKKGTHGHNKYNLENNEKTQEIINNDNDEKEIMNNNKKETKNDEQKLTIPMAIVVAGVLVTVAILLTNGGSKVVKEKTLSEQVGVSKTQLAECTKNTDTTALGQKIQASVEAAMKSLPADQRGTPYSVIVGPNGVKTEIRGADSIENVKKLIAEVNSGTVTAKYTGEVPPVDATDHITGSPTAPVTIIEYSDYECPYCARFHPILEQIVSESNGSVNWVYRHWPIHQNSMQKLVAAECVAQLKGNDAFWKYTDLLFKLIAPVQPAVSDQL